MTLTIAKELPSRSMKASTLVFRRPVKFAAPAAHGRIWNTQCGSYRIRESYLIGTTTPVYYAQTLNEGVWEIAGKHRVRSAAIKTLEKAARNARRRIAKANRH